MSIAPVQTAPPNPVQVAHKSRGGHNSKAAQTNQLAQKNNGVTTPPRGATSVFAKQMAGPLVQQTNSNMITIPKTAGQRTSGNGGSTKSSQKPANPKNNSTWNTPGSIIDMYA